MIWSTLINICVILRFYCVFILVKMDLSKVYSQNGVMLVPFSPQYLHPLQMKHCTWKQNQGTMLCQGLVNETLSEMDISDNCWPLHACILVSEWVDTKELKSLRLLLKIQEIYCAFIGLHFNFCRVFLMSFVSLKCLWAELIQTTLWSFTKLGRRVQRGQGKTQFKFGKKGAYWTERG